MKRGYPLGIAGMKRDALLLITVKKNEITHILSEDFQDGIILEEVTVINPFSIDNLFEVNTAN